MTTTTAHAGRCSRCGALRPLRDDGTIIAHQRIVALQGWRRRWATCTGAGLSPAVSSVPGVSSR